MACWAQLEFSEPISPIIWDFLYFHDHIMLILTFIISYVGFIILTAFFNPVINVNLVEHQLLEVIWTLFPVFILLYIGAPSLYILYSIDYEFFFHGKENFISIKVVGHQWYWSYNSASPHSQEEHAFDSYISPSERLAPGEFRLLEVDNRIVVPCEILTKFLITSADVLHSWTIPALGVKIDACPGRLNQITALISHPGVFYGQCSEICGANHSFIPICLEARFLDEYLASQERAI